jgi:hypothetical protein
MQRWHKGPGPKVAATRQNRNNGHSRQTTVICEKEEGNGGWRSGELSCLGRRGPVYKTHKKTLELEFVKRANGMSNGFREIRK